MLIPRHLLLPESFRRLADLRMNEGDALKVAGGILVEPLRHGVVVGSLARFVDCPGDGIECGDFGGIDDLGGRFGHRNFLWWMAARNTVQYAAMGVASTSTATISRRTTRLGLKYHSQGSRQEFRPRPLLGSLGSRHAFFHLLNLIIRHFCSPQPRPVFS